VPQATFESSIDHIIILAQENRSFDNYFGMLADYRRRNGFPNADDIDGLPADASNPGFTATGQLDRANPIAAFHSPTVCTDDLSSTWNESHRNWDFAHPTTDAGLLDGFVAEAAAWARNNKGIDVQGKRAMGFFTEKEIPFYYALASNFAISDRYFCSMLSHTQPNRMYMLSGSSYGKITSLKNYPPPLNGAVAGKTIFDLCNDHNVTWKIYSHGRAAKPSTFTYLQLFKSYAAMGGAKNPNIVDGGQFALDAQAGTLPQVSLIEIASGGLDEHPGNNLQDGAAVAATYFRALMGSPSWAKSAMILTYDEHGACYDHVPPPPAVPPDDIAPQFLTPFDVKVGFDRYGFRVPFVMVSPWSRKNFVSHVVNDHTSILKMIETRFNMPPLTRRDAVANDLTDMLDFSTGQPAFATPPTLPDPVHTVCNKSLL
jgi:phospholipase C